MRFFGILEHSERFFRVFLKDSFGFIWILEESIEDTASTPEDSCGFLRTLHRFPRVFFYGFQRIILEVSALLGTLKFLLFLLLLLLLLLFFFFCSLLEVSAFLSIFYSRNLLNPSTDPINAIQFHFNSFDFNSIPDFHFSFSLTLITAVFRIGLQEIQADSILDSVSWLSTVSSAPTLVAVVVVLLLCCCCAAVVVIYLHPAGWIRLIIQ